MDHISLTFYCKKKIQNILNSINVSLREARAFSRMLLEVCSFQVSHIHPSPEHN